MNRNATLLYGYGYSGYGFQQKYWDENGGEEHLQGFLQGFCRAFDHMEVSVSS